MKKAIMTLVLAFAFVVLGQAQVRESMLRGLQALREAPEQADSAQEPLLAPRQAQANDGMQVTLYYRFGDTRVLGMELTRLNVRREETVARRIVEKLVAGPDMAHGCLSALFPHGTRVLDVTEEGDTVFVTLNEAFLGRPDGAPVDWEDLTLWQEEATLRRYLAAQSIVCSLTEGGRCQRVQLYVAQDEDDAPRRVPLVMFDLSVSDPSVVLAAMSRDEAAVLTPQRAMQMLLEAWQRRDWATVYALLCADEGETMPTRSAFEAEMRRADVTLLTAEISGGTVDASGTGATIVLDGAVRSASGGQRSIIREAVPLVRAADNWAMRLSTLRALMEETN